MGKENSESCFEEWGCQINKYALIVIIFLLLPLISLPSGLAQPADSSSKWDQPFDTPMYLLHSNGGKHYDSSSGKDIGTFDNQRWILHPQNVEFIEIPWENDARKKTRFNIDKIMGLYHTRKEVCSVADLVNTPAWLDRSLYVLQAGDFVPLFDCNCANACDKSKHLVWDGYEGCSCICEEGWKFDENRDCKLDTSEADEVLEGGIKDLEDEILVETSQGTTVAKPGEAIWLYLDGNIVKLGRVSVKCENMMDALNLLMVVDDNVEDHMGAYGYIMCLLSTACKRQATGVPIKLQKTAEFEDTSSVNYLAKLEFGLQRGSLRMEIVQDEVALDVKTPTMIASTVGKNTLGVAYDPDTGRSSLSAYQNPVSIQPSNSNLAPFTLGAGQQVEVSSEGIGPVTPLGQTSGVTESSTHVSPDGRDIYGPVGGAENAVGQTGMASEGPQSGCYADPFTGQTICIDTFGNPINPSNDDGTAHMMQPDSGSSIPQRLQECETSTSEICGTWTRMGDRFNAQWNNGASATLNVERWDNDAVVITRQDTQGSSAGLTARYEGTPAGNHADGSVTWNWNGATWSGTWTADWETV